MHGWISGTFAMKDQFIKEYVKAGLVMQFLKHTFSYALIEEQGVRCFSAVISHSMR